MPQDAQGELRNALVKSPVHECGGLNGRRSAANGLARAHMRSGRRRDQGSRIDTRRSSSRQGVRLLGAPGTVRGASARSTTPDGSGGAVTRLNPCPAAGARGSPGGRCSLARRSPARRSAKNTHQHDPAHGILPYRWRPARQSPSRSTMHAHPARSRQGTNRSPQEGCLDRRHHRKPDARTSAQKARRQRANPGSVSDRPGANSSGGLERARRHMRVARHQSI